MNKRVYFFAIVLFTSSLSYAQTSSRDTTIDQLQVPSSPAFNLLGISPESIERPKNPTDFAVALGNATSGFTGIPKDFAMELAPGWVFGKKRITFEDFKSNKIGKNIVQTSLISIGTTIAKSQIDSTSFRKIAVAYKVSLFRGYLGSDFQKWGDSISALLKEVSNTSSIELSRLQQNDLDWKLYRSKVSNSNPDTVAKYRNLLVSKNDFLQKQADSTAQSMVEKQITTLKILQSRTDFNRYGFKMDFALGGVWDYPDSVFQNSCFSKFSSWLTLGYQDSSSKFGGLALVRFSQNFNRYFRNDANKIVDRINYGEFDWGVRLFFDATSKLTLSYEHIGRIPIFNAETFDKNNITQPKITKRSVFSVNYKVNKNQNLAFTVGRNFDNTYIKEGNLIAALNLLIGFGSIRPVGGK
jgi:hypothetical protein